VELSRDEKLKVDPALEGAFERMITELEAGKRKVPLVFDLTVQDDQPLEPDEVGVDAGEV
jgi:hypothetical protein